MSELVIWARDEEAKEKRLITVSTEVWRQILLQNEGKLLAKASGTLAGSSMSDPSICKLSWMKIIFPQGGAVMKIMAGGDDFKLLPKGSYYLSL